MSDDVVKIRTWFRIGDKNLNSPAWFFTVEEINAMKIAGVAIVHGDKYEIKEMAFDTQGEAMIIQLAAV
mgnify:CR=1 FL=1